MKETLFAGLFAAISMIAVFAAPTAAVAADADAEVALCAAAADAQGIAAAQDYRAKFLKSKGGAVKTITIKLVPAAGDAASITAECKIKRGEVLDIAVKA